MLFRSGSPLPTIEAREAAEGAFKFPLYGPPPDMLPIDLGAFRPSLAGQIAMARLKNGRVVPYYSRKEIEGGNALVGRGLEIAWVATDGARKHLMLQGSGVLRYPDGRTVNVNYAAQNGHVWSAGPENQSWVFFKLAPDGPFGCDGVPLTDGRAIATVRRRAGESLRRAGWRCATTGYVPDYITDAVWTRVAGCCPNRRARSRSLAWPRWWLPCLHRGSSISR